MKPGKIRPLALCVFRHGDRILTAEGYDRLKQQTFYRPIGGKIEFGELGTQTVIREVMEEIGQAVTGVRYLGTLENIFTYEGAARHEIILLYDAAFEDEAVYDMPEIEGHEDGDLRFIARWLPLNYFEKDDPPLYPTGLLALLRGD